MKRLLLTVGIIITTLLLCSNQLYAESNGSILTRVAQTQDIPEALLRAICETESGDGMNLQAFTEEDHGPGDHAFGACQVLLSTAVGLGFVDQGDRCRDYNTRQRAEYRVCGLFGPVTNFHFAAKYLKKQLKRYNGNWVSAIAAYNAGQVRMCPISGELRNWAGKVIGRCRPGDFANQEYVNKVLDKLGKTHE